MGPSPTGLTQEKRPELAGWTVWVEAAAKGLAGERETAGMDTAPTQNLLDPGYWPPWPTPRPCPTQSGVESKIPSASSTHP